MYILGTYSYGVHNSILTQAKVNHSNAFYSSLSLAAQFCYALRLQSPFVEAEENKVQGVQMQKVQFQLEDQKLRGPG